MIKSVLKTVGAMAAGGIIVFALTYNSKMPEIKTGVDTLTKIAQDAQAKVADSEQTILELTNKLDKLKVEYETLQKNHHNLAISHETYVNMCKELSKEIEMLKAEIERLKSELAKSQADAEKYKADAEFYKGEFEYIREEYWKELDNSKLLYDELKKANSEIEKANKEQVEILDYVNKAIENVE